MPEASFNIEIYCDACGEGLCNQSTFTNTRCRGEPSFRIEPCKSCLEKAKEEGRTDGYNEGYNEAYDKATDEAAAVERAGEQD